MLSQKKSLIENYLAPIVHLFKDVNPNVLTIIGSIPSLLFFVFLINHWYVLALIAFLGTTLDMLDGLVARKYNKETAFGGFLDSFLDRVSDYLLITAFAFAGIVRWELAAPLLLFAYLTSYARSRGELAKSGVSFAIGFIERTERLVLIFFGLLLYMIMPGAAINGYNVAELFFFLTALLSAYTVIQRILYAYKKL